MKQSRHILGWIAELGLWGVANTLCVGLAMGALYGAHQLIGFKVYVLSALAAVTLVSSLTWGSWATLVWTRSRGLRVLQQAVTILPGVLSVLGAGALFYVMPARWLAALVLGVSGIGMIAASVVLAGGVMTKNATPSKLQYATGLLAYPVATLLASSAVSAVWYTFLTNGSGFKRLVGLPSLMVTALTIAMVTTVIPAGISRGCQQLCALWVGRRS